MPITMRRRAETPARPQTIPGGAIPAGATIVQRPTLHIRTSASSTQASAPPELRDGICRAACNLSPAARVAWFLMARYARDVVGRDLVSPACVDDLALRLTRDGVPDTHKSAGLLTPQVLSGAPIPPGDYPQQTRAAADWLLRPSTAA